MGALSQRNQLIQQMKGEEAYKDLSPAELEAKADQLILQQLMYECATATASGMATHGAGTLMAGLNQWEAERNDFDAAEQENRADVQNQTSEEADPSPPQYKTFTEEEVEEYAFGAIQGSPKADGVMLGRYEKNSDNSYDKKAIDYGFQHFYFDKWDELVGIYGKEQLWRINEKFLDIQTSSGRDMYFSHDPLGNYAPDSFFARELQYMRDSKYDFKREGELWHGIR